MKIREEKGCIHLPDRTTGLDYSTGMGVNCACSQRTNCAIKRIIPYSYIHIPCIHGASVDGVCELSF